VPGGQNGLVETYLLTFALSRILNLFSFLVLLHFLFH
jgi:hypothetical protein